MARRDTPTPEQCPACGGTKRVGCRLCKGTGIVPREAAAAFARDRQQRLTGQLEAFEETLQKLVLLIDARRQESVLIHASSAATEAAFLVTEGKELLATFRRVKALRQGDPERTDAVLRMLDFNKRALTYLAGGR